MSYVKQVGPFYIVGDPGHYAAITGPNYIAWTNGNNRIAPRDFRTVDEAEEFILQYIMKKDLDILDS